VLPTAVKLNVLRCLPEVQEHAGTIKSNKNNTPIVLATIHIESAGDSNAVSKTGALGLMQIKPELWIRAGETADMLFDPSFNVKRGCHILNWLYSKYGNTSDVMANYYGKTNKDWEKYVIKFWKAWNLYKDLK